MPVVKGRDKQGPYFRWGDNGKKYHYKPGDKRSKETARGKAKKQGRAIQANS